MRVLGKQKHSMSMQNPRCITNCNAEAMLGVYKKTAIWKTKEK